MRRERSWWLLAAFWTGIIFLSIPRARGLQSAVESWCGRQCFTGLVLAVLAVAVLIGLRHICKRPNPRISLLWLGALGSIYAGWTWQLRGGPEESLHLIQYGVLSILVFRALSCRMQDRLIYVCAFFISSVIGSLDEIVQWLTPERVFDYRDIRLNACAALLAQLATAKVWRPELSAGRPPLRSRRMACGAAALQILILALCLSNTPPVTVWIAAHMPRLAYLQSKYNLMSEYGHRHEDPEIGAFYSRFSRADLHSLDLVRGSEAAGILSAQRRQGGYEDFLRVYTPLTDPFLHELRVHIFRRDEHLSAAHREAPGSRAARRHCGVALRENALLERYFGASLRGSSYELPADQAARLAGCADAIKDYESPVSANLIVSFALWQVWAAAVLLLAGLFFYSRGGREIIGND